MLLIYGVELYGKVHAREGQYIATRFFHVFFLPLLPLGSVHFLGREPGQAHMTKVDLPLHGLSVITAYMRTWAPVVGLLLLPESLLASALLLCLYILSWGEYGATGEEQPRGAGLSAGGGERKSQPVARPKPKARADKSERERQRVEALFQKLRPQLQEPQEEEQAQARAQPAPKPPGRGTG
jgi:hypothetical protein